MRYGCSSDAVRMRCSEVVRMCEASSRAYQKHVRAFMRTLAKSGELWRSHNTVSTRISLTFTRVPAKISLTFTRVPVKVPSACGWSSEFAQMWFGRASLAGPISRDITIHHTIAVTPHITLYFLREVSAPQNGAIAPPLVLSLTQAHLCDTPFCNISRDNCAIPH